MLKQYKLLLLQYISKQNNTQIQSTVQKQTMQTNNVLEFRNIG
jgi:hypothetical protein